MTDQSQALDRPAQCRGRGRAAFVLVIVALAAGVVGALVTKSFSQGFGPPWHGAMMGGPMSPAQIEDRADRAVRHLAIEIDANAEQQAKLQAIVKGAAHLSTMEQPEQVNQVMRQFLSSMVK